MNHASDYGYSILGQLPASGEPKWSRDYWRAMADNRLNEALSIAYEHRADFIWEGYYPEGWTEEQIAEHSHADANLIGAAPELYEALEEAVNWLKAPARDRKLIDPEKLAAVLRKARGEG